MADSTKTNQRVVPLDADKLGHIMGASGAVLVAFVQAFLREADPLTTLFRAGLVFVGIYTASYWLVRRFLKASLLQMIREKSERREERRRKMKERQSEAKAQGPAVLDMLTPVQPEAGVPPPSESGLPQL